MISLRNYAKHRGCTLAGVQKAIATGRLVKSVRRDSAGVPKIGSATEADREWMGSTRSQHVPIIVDARKAEAVAAEVMRRLAELVAADLADLPRHLLRHGRNVVEGAAQELRRGGREPTVAALTKALQLDGEDAGAFILWQLVHLVLEEPPDAADLAGQVGRVAVNGRTQETTNGDT